MFIDLGGELAEGEVAGNGEDFGTRRHDLEDDLVAEFDGGTNELAVGLFKDAFFFASFEKSVYGLGGAVVFGFVLGFRKCGDREKKLQQHGDREDEVEERLQHGQNVNQPETASTGEEQLRQKPVEDQDKKNDFSAGTKDFGGAWGAASDGMRVEWV